MADELPPGYLLWGELNGEVILVHSTVLAIDPQAGGQPWIHAAVGECGTLLPASLVSMHEHWHQDLGHRLDAIERRFYED